MTDQVDDHFGVLNTLPNALLIPQMEPLSQLNGLSHNIRIVPMGKSDPSQPSASNASCPLHCPETGSQSDCQSVLMTKGLTKHTILPSTEFVDEVPAGEAGCTENGHGQATDRRPATHPAFAPPTKASYIQLLCLFCTANTIRNMPLQTDHPIFSFLIVLKS